MNDMVSMHHRLPESLRRRLKVAAAQRGLAMTDIINQAIEMWLDQEFTRMAEANLISGSIPAAISSLLHADTDSLHALIRNLSKDRITLLLTALDAEPDTRHSFGTLVNQLLNAVEDKRAYSEARSIRSR